MSSELERTGNPSTGRGPASDPFEPLSASQGSVEVIHGVYSHTMPLVGMSIDQVRGELSDRMHIDPEAVAVVDGEPVSEELVLAEGQVLTFVKPAGEKGAGSFRTRPRGQIVNE